MPAAQQYRTPGAGIMGTVQAAGAPVTPAPTAPGGQPAWVQSIRSDPRYASLEALSRAMQQEVAALPPEQRVAYQTAPAFQARAQQMNAQSQAIQRQYRPQGGAQGGYAPAPVRYAAPSSAYGQARTGGGYAAGQGDAPAGGYRWSSSSGGAGAGYGAEAGAAGLARQAGDTFRSAWDANEEARTPSAPRTFGATMAGAAGWGA